MNKQSVPSLNTVSHSGWVSSGLYKAKAPSCLFKTYRANADCPFVVQIAKSSYPVSYAPERHWSCPSSRYNLPERRLFVLTSDFHSRSRDICTELSMSSGSEFRQTHACRSNVCSCFVTSLPMFSYLKERKCVSVKQRDPRKDRLLHPPCLRMKIVIAVAAGKMSDKQRSTRKKCCSVPYIR